MREGRFGAYLRLVDARKMEAQLARLDKDAESAGTATNLRYAICGSTVVKHVASIDSRSSHLVSE
jgi:hypothetical protein